MPQSTHFPSRDREHVHVEGEDLRRGFSDGSLHNLRSIGTLNLVSENLSTALIHSGSLVGFSSCAITARFEVVLNPVRSRRTSHEIEPVFVQVKQNRVANHISAVITGNELLGLIYFETVEAIDAKVGQQFEGIRTFNIEVRHMVRLIKESARLSPR